jgi:hypothetical protein
MVASSTRRRGVERGGSARPDRTDCRGRRRIWPPIVAGLAAWLVVAPAGLAGAAVRDRCDQYGLWATNCRVMNWRGDLLKKQLGVQDKPAVRAPKKRPYSPPRRAAKKRPAHKSTAPRRHATPHRNPAPRRRAVVPAPRRPAGAPGHTIRKGLRQVERSAGGGIRKLLRPAVPHRPKAPSVRSGNGLLDLGQLPPALVGKPLPDGAPWTKIGQPPTTGVPGLRPAPSESPQLAPTGSPLGGSKAAPGSRNGSGSSAATPGANTGAAVHPSRKTKRPGEVKDRGFVAEAFDGVPSSMRTAPGFNLLLTTVVLLVLLQQIVTHRRRQIVALAAAGCSVLRGAAAQAMDIVPRPHPRTRGRHRLTSRGASTGGSSGTREAPPEAAEHRPSVDGEISATVGQRRLLPVRDWAVWRLGAEWPAARGFATSAASREWVETGHA